MELSTDRFDRLANQYFEEMARRHMDEHHETYTVPVTVRMSTDFRDELDRLANHFEIPRNTLCNDLLRVAAGELQRTAIQAVRDEEKADKLARHLIVGED